jgi:hypothetical protein
MSEAYIIAVHTGPAETGAPVLTEILLQSVGIQPRRVQDIHWVGWQGLSTAHADLEIGASTALFHWPETPLMTHHLLHSLARIIEAGERDIIVLGQFNPNREAAVLLLASPVIVGRYNLLPRARLSKRLVHPTAGFLAAARFALEVKEPQEDEETTVPAEPVELSWLAAAAPFGSGELKDIFPGASWLLPGTAEPAVDDLCMLVHLLNRLEERRQGYGMLVSESPWGTTMGTLIERI